MRLLATIRRPASARRHRARFHTAALLVLFAGLAWIADTQQERPQPRTLTLMTEGCRQPSSDPIQPVPNRPCAFASASLPSR